MGAKINAGNSKEMNVISLQYWLKRQYCNEITRIANERESKQQRNQYKENKIVSTIKQVYSNLSTI